MANTDILTPGVPQLFLWSQSLHLPVRALPVRSLFFHRRLEDTTESGAAASGRSTITEQLIGWSIFTAKFYVSVRLDTSVVILLFCFLSCFVFAVGNYF